jgi:uncharacterized protein (TIGR04141 family)
MAEKNNKLTVHLIKRDVPADQVMKPGAVGVAMEGIGVFYAENSHASTPKWFSDFFGEGANSPFRLLTASSKGVLILSMPVGDEERTFAVLFGHGRFLMNEGVAEERFGLKIVLNTMVKDSFRSVDRTALGSVPKQSREQTSRESAASSFGIDIEQDLVRSVTARSRDPRFGKTISGRDAITASAKFDAADIRDFLALCMERYGSDDYKADFEWIDQIKDVRDPKTVSALNDALVQRIKEGNLANIWMAAPDIVDWVDIRGFRFSRSKKAELHDDLELEEFIASLGHEAITLDLIKARPVVAVSSKSDDAAEQWNAFQCIYAESAHDGRMFILNNGRWYEIAKTFAEQVVADYLATPDSAVVLPEYEHESEGAYNDAAIGSLAGSCSMDRKMIHHGGGHSSIEFCDLLTGDKKLIHVKRYSGSAQLSHLFAQGAVSGELFVQDAQFRHKLNEELPEGHKIKDPTQQPDPREYEIVFAIVVGTENLDIPFFSKVSLRNARRRLQGYGYTVTKKRIATAKAEAA